MNRSKTGLNPNSAEWREAVAERLQDSLDREYTTTRMTRDDYEEQNQEINAFVRGVAVSDSVYDRMLRVVN